MRKGKQPCDWWKSAPSRGNSQCKGLKVEMCLACLKNSKKAAVTRAEQARRAVGDETRVGVETRSWGRLCILVEYNEKPWEDMLRSNRIWFTVLFNNRFIEIEFTCHTVYPLKAYSSMVLSIFPDMSSYHHYLIPERLLYPQNIYPLAATSLFHH